MNLTIHTSDNLFCSNSSPTLELSVKFASQICHENPNTPLGGTYLADVGIDVTLLLELEMRVTLGVLVLIPDIDLVVMMEPGLLML